MRSQGSIKTYTSLPDGASVIPINFGVKYKPAKLGLEYKLDTLPSEQLCIYEVTLTRYIEQGMNTTQIVDLIFDLHREFINPKVIARRQVTRLIDRLLTRVAPDLIMNRNNENKENLSGNNTAQATPAKPGYGGHNQNGADMQAYPQNSGQNSMNQSKDRLKMQLQLNMPESAKEP